MYINVNAVFRKNSLRSIFNGKDMNPFGRIQVHLMEKFLYKELMFSYYKIEAKNTRGKGSKHFSFAEPWEAPHARML